MSKYAVSVLTILVALAVACLAFGALPLTAPSARTSAGGLPCFFCHGLQAQGSDIAPPLAGTHLTDEQIFKQVRSPRGVMPAFPEFDGQPFVIQWIRSAPTGQPTMTFSPEQRSSALAMIAAAASKRATEVLRAAANATPSMTERPTITKTLSPSPTATVLATATDEPVGSTAGTSSGPPVRGDGGPSTLLVLTSGFAITMLGSFWWIRRRARQAS